jgi:hypothetical protein
MPLTSTVAIMPAIKAVARWYMIPSLELLLFTLDLPIIALCSAPRTRFLEGKQNEVLVEESNTSKNGHRTYRSRNQATGC